MVGRKIICKIITGSRLYGTNRPDSDEDYTGVFLPSTSDLLGLQNCPTEWTENIKKSDGDRNAAGDVDCKYYSLQRFFNLAAQGQPGQLELLFAPESKIVHMEPEWATILVNRNFFLSRNGINPFVGFALAQAHKTTVKGENLNQIREIIRWGDKMKEESSLNHPLSDFFIVKAAGSGYWSLVNSDIRIKALKNDFGYLLAEVAGRQYDIGTKLKTFLNNMKELEGRYGTRSEAAAEVGYDYKSLMHAYRLLGQAREFLETGLITLPRPDADFLKTIINKQYESDYFSEITAKIDEIRQNVEPNSPLPKQPNRSKIEELCHAMLSKHLFGE